MRGIDFNKDWKFRLAEETSPAITKEQHGIWNPWHGGADVYTETVRFDEDDSTWRTIRLPHDWSVEFPFDLEKGDGATAYMLGGTGWYRKHFVTTEEMIGNKVFVNFDGIYNRANIYCNEKFITFHAYGYSPCLVDLTPYLNPVGEENVINVKVDHTRYIDSRWYTGSGIYRNVSMYILPQVNIPVWGLYFTTPQITKEKATVAGEIEIINNLSKDVRVNVNIKIEDYEGNVVAERDLARFLEASQKDVLTGELEIFNPILWDINDPKMYNVKVTTSMDGKEIQTESVKIGVRTCEFDPEKGFFLNGRHVKIWGCCLHHDAGLVGAAVPNDVWRRRLLLMKEAGCNAIRTAHNPYSEDFLDLCDEIGLLVQEEFYDEWDFGKDKRMNCFDRILDYKTRGYADFFREFAKTDLQTVVKRDRNHPAIFQWSLGNEIEWCYPRLESLSGYFEKDNKDFNWAKTAPPLSIEEIQEAIKKVPEDQYEIAKTANDLATWTKELDKSRVVVSNCVMPAVSYEIGYTDALDIVGFSHRGHLYEHFHKNYPQKMIQASEAGCRWQDFNYLYDKDYVAGIFVWTGINYMGETSSMPEKQRGFDGPMLDFVAFKRPSFYETKAWWSDELSVGLATKPAETSIFKKAEDGTVIEKEKGLMFERRREKSLIAETWNYSEGEEILVEAASNAEEVTLYVNGEAKHTVLIKDCVDRTARWIVPFEAGEIKAVAKQGDKTCEFLIKTAGEFAKIELVTDKKCIKAEYDSVAHVEVILKDKDGVRIPNADKEVKFILDGPYINMGVDNGAAESLQTYQQDVITTSKGRAMIILQGKEQGTITAKAVSGDISSEIIEIIVK
ncbi:MAG: glycoside hydrolase family 2 TIM barrel-domain containing protein [Clostridia bacterium]